MLHRPCRYGARVDPSVTGTTGSFSPGLLTVWAFLDSCQEQRECQRRLVYPGHCLVHSFWACALCPC